MLAQPLKNVRNFIAMKSTARKPKIPFPAQSFLLCGLAALLLAAAAGYTMYTSRTLLFVDISVSFDSPAEKPVSQLFYNVDGSYTEEDSQSQWLQPGARPQRLRFQLPGRDIHGLRFDPLNDEGEVTIHEVQVIDNRGEPLLRLDPARILPLNQVASLRLQDGGVTVTTIPGADDPSLVLELPLSPFPAQGDASFGPVFRFSLLLFAVLMAFFTLSTLLAGILAGRQSAGQ